MGAKTEIKTSQTGMKRFRPQNGFSFLELALVVFILSLMAVLSLPRLGDFLWSSRMDAAVRSITRTVTYARSSAATSAGTLYLHVDMAQRRYWLSRDPSRESKPERREDLAEVHRLPDSIRFRDVITAGRGRVAEGRTTIRFAANGTVETADIHLRGPSDRDYTISVHPLTGRVKVKDSYVVQRDLE